jgi:hypothetical protein
MNYDKVYFSLFNIEWISNDIEIFSDSIMIPKMTSERRNDNDEDIDKWVCKMSLL